MPRKQIEQTPKKKTKEKSPKKSEDPKMDEAELNRLAARAEQNLENRITALREEIEKKHQFTCTYRMGSMHAMQWYS